MSETPVAFAERFLSRFALPLCSLAGGPVHIGAPLGRPGLQRLRQAAAQGLDGTTAGAALGRERQTVLAELLPPGEPPRLDQDEAMLGLLVAVHDAAVLLHPGAAGGRVTQGQRWRIARQTMALCKPAQPLSTAAVLERHSLLHRLFTLDREDTRVIFWAGRQEFLGVAPPARLLAWRGLRRVELERWRVQFYLQLIGLPDGLGRACLEALVSASPLTDVLNPRRMDPPLDLLRHVALLREPWLARAIAGHYLELGLADIAAPLRACLLEQLARLGRLQEEGRAEPAGRGDLATLLCFLSHLHLCVLLAEPEAPSGDAPETGLRDLYALFAALLHHFPALAVPADVTKDAALARRVRGYGERCLRLGGAARVDELARLCARALGELL